jgi:gliding motility-associated protein GldC
MRSSPLPACLYLCHLLNLVMNKSTITIDVVTDDNKIPDSIAWSATDTSADNAQKAKAMMISFWDGAEKAALRIDLWTKEMMVDEMADFFYQTLMTMADTYGRATRYHDQVDELKQFAKGFYEKFRERQMKENKAG